MSELGNLEDLALLMFGMMYLVLLVLVTWLVTVCGDAVVIRRAHIHEAAMFARAASIWGHTTGPALTITTGGPVSVLKRLIFDVGIGI